MARAMLSTGASHHPEDGSRFVCGLNEESALREARRVLAESEGLHVADTIAGRFLMVLTVIGYGRR